MKHVLMYCILAKFKIPLPSKVCRPPVAPTSPKAKARFLRFKTSTGIGMAELTERRERRTAHQTQGSTTRWQDTGLESQALGEASRVSQDRKTGAHAHIQRHYTTSSHGVQHVVSTALRRSIADAYAAVVAQV